MRKILLPLASAMTLVFAAQAFALNPQPLPPLESSAAHAKTVSHVVAKPRVPVCRVPGTQPDRCW
jgi:hypothetical protein